jgi:hypothetical protein
VRLQSPQSGNLGVVLCLCQCAMSPHTTDIQPVIEGILESDGVIRCREVDSSAEEDRRRGWCGVRRPGCVDPTVLQALADESVLSLQISSESVPCRPREEFSLKVARFLGRRRARGQPTPFGIDGEVSEETYVQFSARRDRQNPVRMGRI